MFKLIFANRAKNCIMILKETMLMIDSPKISKKTLTLEQEILIVNDTRDFGFSYYSPFKPYGKYRGINQSIDEVKSINLDNVRLVVFTGGADVNPSLYGDVKHPKTHCAEKRDWYEGQIFKKALERKIPCFGICRGAQLLCVMSGGKLNQHSPNHYLSHELIIEDGREIKTNSSHHQVQLPTIDSKIIAWTISPNEKLEAEAVEYPTINSAGVQFHPEAFSEDHEALLFTREMVEKLIG